MSRLDELRSLPRQTAAVARALALARSGRTHPRLDGRVEVRGPQSQIEVIRDRFGVPHIYGLSDADALFGQGFVHAQDRLFQIDLFRRLAAGRLSEIAGDAGLETDRLMRRLGFADRAGRDLASLDDRERELLLAYAAGINAGVRSLAALPPEYTLLGVVPEPWHPEHSLLVGRFLMFGFAPNWDAELERERLLAAVGAERAALVDAPYPEGRPTTGGQPYPGAAERLIEAYCEASTMGVPTGGASNAWALAGSHTASGEPLLACDPHLQARIPGLLHVAHVSGANIDAIGAGVAGLPGIIIGHNREVAWGVTAGLADVSDCYLEAIDRDDPGRYRTPDGWARGRIRIERIAVRDAATVEERVLETRHGPIIGPAHSGDGHAIALRSTALEAGETLGPLLDLNRARDLDEFDAAVARWPGATFNFVFASREGRLGFRLAGSIPRRRRGHGLLPQDGERSPGPPPPIPPDELPSILDPASGVIVSANQAPGGSLELGEEWCEPWRVERLEELLAARSDHTVASLQAIQCDSHSEPLRRLRDLSLARDVIADWEVKRVVASWDAATGADSAGAAVLETVYGQLARRAVRRVVGSLAPLVLGEGAGGISSESRFHYRLQGRLIEALEAADPPWYDNPADRDRVLRAAWWSAVEQLRSQLGPHPHDWSWGALHQQLLPHPLDSVPAIGRAFSRGPYATGGDINTIAQGGYTVYAGPAAAGGYSPAYRQVIDLGRWDRSTFQLPAGNSGIPGHPRYDDSIEEFLAGTQRPLLYSRSAVEANVEHRLELQPAAGAWR